MIPNFADQLDQRLVNAGYRLGRLSAVPKGTAEISRMAPRRVEGISLFFSGVRFNLVLPEQLLFAIVAQASSLPSRPGFTGHFP